jgi:type IV secretory pathway ATPase VirB11/archaellum biosynthesis ATPase
VTISDIQKDVILSEELMDKPLTEFLRKLANIVEKHEDEDKPIVVLVTETGMSIHIVNPDEVSDNITDYLTDATS